MARIFLCHANEDKPRVEALYDRLRALGFEPWMDKRDLIPGQRWQREIPRALKASALMLICLSHNIGGPGYLQREFNLALDALQEIPEDMIHTIPVRLDPCNVPDQFFELHWCNLFEPNGFDVLVSAIRYGLVQRGEPIPELKASIFTNTIDMEFILIPAGSFMMGSPDSDTEAWAGEKPVHRVTISQPFYLGKYPVTQAQWEAVMGHNPSRFKGNPNGTDVRIISNLSMA